jgi:hypothetical protein
MVKAKRVLLGVGSIADVTYPELIDQCGREYVRPTDNGAVRKKVLPAPGGSARSVGDAPKVARNKAEAIRIRYRPKTESFSVGFQSMRPA